MSSPLLSLRLVTGEWVDEDVRDPLGSMFALLAEKRDKALVQEWGVWLLKYNAEEAMKVRVFVVYKVMAFLDTQG